MHLTAYEPTKGIQCAKGCKVNSTAPRTDDEIIIYRDDTLGKIVRVKCIMEEDQPD